MTVNGLPYEEVPQEAKDYIAANYTDYMVEPMAELLTLADNSVQYFIHVKNMESKLRVRMTAAGSFICEQ